MFSTLSQIIFGERGILFGGLRGISSSRHERHRRIGFDLKQSDLQLGLGEALIASFFPIEDIKGNPDEMGLLKITNQRLIWISVNKRGVNLSIGWDTVNDLIEQNCKDSLGGDKFVINVMTNFAEGSYEFSFAVLASGACGGPINETNGSVNPKYFVALFRLRDDDKKSLTDLLTPSELIDCFDVIKIVEKSYKRGLLYRHCAANSFETIKPIQSSANNDQLTIIYDELPGENKLFAYKKITYVGSKAVQKPGIMILTNIRIIWIDDEFFAFRNLSMPYSRISHVTDSTNQNKQSCRLTIHTIDVMKDTRSFKFTWKKSTDDVVASQFSLTPIAASTPDDQFKLNYDNSINLTSQVLKLLSLYQSKPRFGPESNDDCLRIASLLRPLDEIVPTDSFFTNINDSKQATTVKTSDNKLSIHDKRIEMLNNDFIETTQMIKQTNSKTEQDTKKLEEFEREFNNQNLNTNSTKFASYATKNRLIELDRPIIYCVDLCFAKLVRSWMVLSRMLVLNPFNSMCYAACYLIIYDFAMQASPDQPVGIKTSEPTVTGQQACEAPINELHPSSSSTITTAANSKHKSRDLSGMSTKHDSQQSSHHNNRHHRRNHSTRPRSDRKDEFMQKPQLQRQLQRQLQQQPPSAPATPKRCQNCSNEMLTYTLFMTSFFLSLAVYSIGQANSRVTADQTESNSPTQEHPRSYLILLLLGFLGIIISIGGFVLNCMDKLPYKYLRCWTVTTGLIILEYTLIWLSDPASKATTPIE